MAITIDIANTKGLVVDGVRVSFQEYLDAFEANFTPEGYGQFNESNGPYPAPYEGTEYITSEDAALSGDTSAQAVVANGDLSYNMTTHQLTGTIDEIEFGFGASEVSDDFQFAVTDIVIGNLGITGSDVSTVISGTMNGDPSALEAILAANAIQFNGSDKGDIFTGSDFADTIRGNHGSDVLYGGNGADRINGGKAGDMLYGEGGNDSLVGDAGNDTLDGGRGLDRLNGGIGNDTLTGGSGSDTFVFDVANFGVDTITDFASNDIIRFATSLFDDFASVLGATSTNGDGDAVISLGDNSITLIDVAKADLVADDFIFA
ncbi:calcium-binding protein [Methylobrevis pamukkalensis]|uniref:Hemolysin, chromosomal n=1 Tax=Methylobrevis pamukkalensis TaxID=1439726 RepID=A0A1E3H211_9HYPH|nr:calcium-binding protein [Methylobrevis pamukkalensis]ODN70368.1 Hemolysin, chromosomal [Methylobrevis pamukkalensis]